MSSVPIEYTVFKQTGKYYTSGEFTVNVDDKLLALEGEERRKLYFEMHYNVLPMLVDREFPSYFNVVIMNDNNNIIGFPFMRPAV